MRELVPVISGWLMNYLLQSAVMLTLLGAAAWLGDRLLGRVGPGAQHRMWVTALLAGVGLPLLPTGWIAALVPAHAAAATATMTVASRAAAAADGRWTVSPLLCAAAGAAYLLIVLISLSRLLWRWRHTAAMAQRSRVLPLDQGAPARMEDAARRFGIRAPAVRGSDEICGPVVLGWRRPLLLVPAGFFAAGHRAEDMAAAMAHECAHIARRDFAKNLLYEFVASVVSYHPACRLMQRRIAETRELACDEMAAGSGDKRPEYAASLLRLATAMATPAMPSAAIGVFDANILEERIMRLTMDLPKISPVRTFLAAMVVACVLTSGGMAAALSFEVMPRTNSSIAGHEKIYKIGNGVSAPVLVHSVDAEYSKKARDAKYQGVSIVSCIVGTDGIPQHVHTVKKLGMGLDEKALEAVRQYRFTPAMLKGQPVAVAITIEVNFRIY